MEPLISIIVPVYKVEKYLPKCIDSIVSQSYRNLEIILVDDGSPDRCPEICDEWAEKDSRIKVIHKKNGGLSSARNAGLDIAQGALIAFVDSDDYVDSRAYEKAVVLLETTGADIVVFDACKITESGKMLGGTEKLNNCVLSQEQALSALMQGRVNNYAWNKLYRRACFNGIRFPEGRTWEDMAIAYKLFLNAKTICTSTDQLYYYLQRSGSIVNNISGKALGDIYLARYESYMALKGIYPKVAELVFPKVALCALRLYDRSLWESVNEEILKDAQDFLKENREQILKTANNAPYKRYYNTPGLYDFLRRGKHLCGNVVKGIKKSLRGHRS